MTDELRIMRDGKELATVSDPNAAFQWLIKHQGQSVHYAITYGGYSVVDQIGNDVFTEYREQKI